MEDVNRIKLVLVEKKRTNKWLSEQMGGNPLHSFKMVYQFLSARPSKSIEDCRLA